jgi:hypothetical protein
MKKYTYTVNRERYEEDRKNTATAWEAAQKQDKNPVVEDVDE